MTLEDKVHAFRLHLFRRAQELGNVSAACRELGVSRSLYYQLRERFQRYGADGLHPTRRRGRPGRPPQLDATVERQVVALSLSWPTWVPRQLSDQFALRGVRVAESTVYRALRRLGLGTTCRQNEQSQDEHVSGEHERPFLHQSRADRQAVWHTNEEF